jgi:hypothetical protein
LPVKIDLEIPYSSEEAKWFDSRMVKYATAVGEVPMGPEWIKEFVMFTYDVPLSKHFASRGYSTFLERYRRVLRIHDGFADLSKKDQVCNDNIKKSIFSLHHNWKNFSKFHLCSDRKKRPILGQILKCATRARVKSQKWVLLLGKT